ncbi:MAG: hypothetical protein R6X23_08430 [Acidimicrobiia bacterium]
MDPRPRPSETELVRLLGEAWEAVEQAEEQAEASAIPNDDSARTIGQTIDQTIDQTIGRRVAGRGRKRFEGALPLEDFLREIADST